MMCSFNVVLPAVLLGILCLTPTFGDQQNSLQPKNTNSVKCSADQEVKKLCEQCSESLQFRVSIDQCCQSPDVVLQCLDRLRVKRDTLAEEGVSNANQLYNALSTLRVNRARPFLGKRSRISAMLGKRPRNNFLGKRDENIARAIPLLDYLQDEDEDDKRARPFLGKKARPFLGKRDDDTVYEKLMEAEADEKRARPFLGKRARPFLGKRTRPFLGKRNFEEDIDGLYGNEEKRMRPFLGKRGGSRPFLGKRGGSRPFLGKRGGSRPFLGKRDDEELLGDLSYFLDSKNDALADDDTLALEKRSTRFAEDSDSEQLEANSDQ